jgi:RNA polymerase sigma factor (sigma-70 family)
LAFPRFVRFVIVTAMFDESARLRSERRRLVGLCTAITGDRAAADDLAQETLLEAWRSRHKLRDAAGAERWLNAIARNVCLRWARRRGRDAAVIAAVEVDGSAELDVDLGRNELEELLDRALSLLPPATRDVLVHHYVEGSPHAEIAASQGISTDAVSMRISRGRVVLRRLLAAELGEEPADGWGDTRVWCSSCGAGRLQMRRDADSVAFRCATCGPGPGAVYDLGNPSFARLVDGLVRPAAILNRAAAWSSDYFGGGAGEAGCTRCNRPLRLRHHSEGARRGLHADCRGCGQEVWSSVRGLAQSRPEARAFRAEHARVRTLPERDLDYRGAPAMLVRLEPARGGAALDVVFEFDTLRVLAAH